MDEKILVTGATGRIGKHLVKALIKSEGSIRILVREKMTEFENVEVFYGDIRDKEAVRKAVDGIDILFHLAAVVDYTAPHDTMFDVNVMGTKNILDSFRGKKFVYLSSAAVLGKKFKEPINEETPYKPTNFYGKTKMEAEKLVRAKDGIVVRAPDVLMPRFIEGYDMVFSRILKGKMPIIGDGKNFVDFIHVSDLIDALMMAAEKGRGGEIYNISSKDFKTQNECLQIAAKYLDVDPPKKHVSAFSAKLGSTFSKGFIPEYIDKIVRSRTYDLTKARNELGFEPKIDIETCIREMVEDFLNRVKEEEDQVSEEKSEQQS